MPKLQIQKDGPPGTKYARSENGWIDTNLFEHWFNNHFLTHAVSSRPLFRWAQDTLSASRLPGS